MARGRGLGKALRMGLVAGVGLAVLRAARARRAASKSAPPTWPPLPSVLAEHPPAAASSERAQVVEPGLTAGLVAEAAVLEAAGVTEAAEVDEEAVAAWRTAAAEAEAAAVATEPDDIMASWPPPIPGTAMAEGEWPPPAGEEGEPAEAGDAVASEPEMFATADEAAAEAADAEAAAAEAAAAAAAEAAQAQAEAADAETAAAEAAHAAAAEAAAAEAAAAEAAQAAAAEAAAAEAAQVAADEAASAEAAAAEAAELVADHSAARGIEGGDDDGSATVTETPVDAPAPEIWIPADETVTDLDSIILAEEAALEEERLETERLELARLESTRIRAEEAEEEATAEARRAVEIENEEALARFAAQREEARMLLALQEEREEARLHDELGEQLEPADGLPDAGLGELAEPGVADDIHELTWPEDVDELELSARLVEEDELSAPTLQPLVPDEAVADLEEEPAWGSAAEEPDEAEIEVAVAGVDEPTELAASSTTAVYEIEYEELQESEAETATEVEDDEELELVDLAEPGPSPTGEAAEVEVEDIAVSEPEPVVAEASGGAPSDYEANERPIMTGDPGGAVPEDQQDEEDELALAQLRRKRREALARFIAKREEAELLLAKQEGRETAAQQQAAPTAEARPAAIPDESVPLEPEQPEILEAPIRQSVGSSRGAVGRRRPLMADFDDVPPEDLLDEDEEDADQRTAASVRGVRRTGRPRVPLKARRAPETDAAPDIEPMGDGPTPPSSKERVKRPAPRKAAAKAAPPAAPKKVTRVAKSDPAAPAGATSLRRVGTTKAAKRAPSAQAPAAAPTPAGRTTPVVTSKAVKAPARKVTKVTKAATASPVPRPSAASAPPRPATAAKAAAASSRTPARPPVAAKPAATKKVSARRRRREVQWVEPIGSACPTSHPVKASMASGIFHVIGGLFYERTNPDRCYRSAASAEADGLRQAKR